MEDKRGIDKRTKRQDKERYDGQKKVNNSNSKRATSRINYNKHVVNINNKN